MVAKELKSLAKHAKKSLLDPNYMLQSTQEIAQKDGTVYFLEYMAQFPKLEAKYVFHKIDAQTKKEFEKRVKLLIKEHSNEFNYIGALVDKRKFNKMTDAEKQRVVFCTADRFLHVINK